MAEPFVEVQLDRRRRIRFTTLALARYSRTYGEHPALAFLYLTRTDEGRRDAVEQPDPARLLGLLWFGLLWEDNGLTEAQVAALIDGWKEAGGSEQELAQRLIEAGELQGILRRLNGQAGRVKGAAPANPPEPLEIPPPRPASGPTSPSLRSSATRDSV